MHLAAAAWRIFVRLLLWRRRDRLRLRLRTRRRRGRRFGTGLQARLNFVNHAELVHKFYAARIREMHLTIRRTVKAGRIQVGAFEFRGRYTGGVNHDRERSSHSNDAHCESRLAKNRHPGKTLPPTLFLSTR